MGITTAEAIGVAGGNPPALIERRPRSTAAEHGSMRRRG